MGSGLWHITVRADFRIDSALVLGAAIFNSDSAADALRQHCSINPSPSAFQRWEAMISV